MCSVLLLAPVALWAAATAPEPDLNKTFKRMEVQIPMRDGVKLYTDIYIPKKSRGQLPFLFTRTPYGSTDDKGRNGALPHSYKDFVDEGYIFVFQDIRGRYKSEGQFVMFRPPRDKSDAKAIDESTDTYDTIAWLIEHMSQQQRARRRAGNLLRRLADGDGHARSASRRSRRFPNRRRPPTSSWATIFITTARSA